MKKLLIIGFLYFFLSGCDKRSKNSSDLNSIVQDTTHGAYQAKWSSIDKRRTPNWWIDAKFGIFIHWGVYSVPAFAPVRSERGIAYKYAEHYESRLIDEDEVFLQHHKQHFGEKFSYRDFAGKFKAEYFNPDEWAELFKKSGAKYVVLTAKHHDGFCLWPSKQSPNWNSVKVGPHRDIINDITSSVRKKGLKMGLYYSLLEWSNPLYSKSSMDKWVDSLMMPQLKDLVNRYHPEILFTDGEWDYTSDVFKSESFLAWLFNSSPVKNSVVINDRWGKETRSKHGGYYTTEYNFVHDSIEIGSASSNPWEESRGIGTSYGYNRFETTESYLTSKQLIHLLISKVSNGGNLLLNIGPDANGLIPVIMQERLLDMGEWLKVNGDAIYGTSVWNRGRLNNQKEVFFTQKGKDVYVFCTKWPRVLKIEGIRNVSKVSLMGMKDPLLFTLEGSNLNITPPVLAPDSLPCNYAWVFKIENASN